ncbi:MAG: CDP-diacylglycerol--glycerol-3-phosphate 3-phosphatidyltransferase [Thermoleophilia bacterium]
MRRRIPNALSLLRLAALPVLLWMLATAEGPTAPWAGLLFGLVGATDLLDGYLARRWHAESRFGRIVDPLADRLLVIVGLVGLILLGRFHWTGPAILIARDVLIVLAYALLMRRGIEMRVDMAGKISSALAMVGTGGAMLLDQAWVDVIFWAAVVLSVATFLNYARIAAGELRAQRASTLP